MSAKTDSREGRTIILPCFGIVVRLAAHDASQSGPSCAGRVISDLHESVSDSDEDSDYEAAIDGIESLILAHACAGVDIASPAYIEGIQTAVEAVTNSL